MLKRRIHFFIEQKLIFQTNKILIIFDWFIIIGNYQKNGVSYIQSIN